MIAPAGQPWSVARSDRGLSGGFTRRQGAKHPRWRLYDWSIL